MKIFITTSDKYCHVCPISVEFLNKYWPDQDIVVLGYEGVKMYKDMPENVEVVSLGDQASFGKTWTDALIPYFENVSDDYFVVLCEDLILMNKVDLDIMQKIEEKMKNGSAEKAMIGGGIPLNRSSDYEDGLVVFDQDVNYRLSLHPAIWEREYFLKYLKPSMSCWQFELMENEKAKNDGARIIAHKYSYPEEPHLFSNLNLYHGGAVMLDKDANISDNQPSKRHFSEDDLKYIRRTLETGGI